MPTFISDSRGGTGRGQAAVSGRSVDADDSAAPLEQERVAPAPAHTADPLTAAHHAESMLAMQRERGGILGRDAFHPDRPHGGPILLPERAEPHRHCWQGSSGSGIGPSTTTRWSRSATRAATLRTNAVTRPSFP